jgi:hypothetical protein
MNNLTVSNYPDPLNKTVIANTLTWTSVNDISDTSKLTYITNTAAPTITFYDVNPDFSLKTTSVNRTLTNYNDSTIVNSYLSYDVYAYSFMNNSANVVLPTTLIDISKYTNIGIGTDLKNANTTTTPAKITYNSKDYYLLSMNNANAIIPANIKTVPTAETSTSVRIKIIKSVLYSLISLYYNPGTEYRYNGLVNDLTLNYSVGIISKTGASTVGLTFTTASKHAVWLYLISRASWINDKLINNTY